MRKISNFKFQISRPETDQPLAENGGCLFIHGKLAIGNWKFPKGFTLIELLVSTTVVMTIGIVMVIVFFAALRGTDKSNVLVTVRQNGNFAIAQMSKQIRLAETINNFSACSSEEDTHTLSLTSGVDQSTMSYVCDENNIASVSAAGTSYLLDASRVEPASACTFTCGVQETGIPYVTVYFRLTNAGDSPFAERNTPAYPFTTTILLRNTLAQ